MKSWEEFLQNQRDALGPEAIEKWAKSLKVVHFDAGNLYLEAQDSFQLNWFEEHLRPKILQQFRNNNQRPIKVHLSLANAPTAKIKKEWKPTLNLSPDGLDPACSFATYFPGKTNELHLALLKEALDKPSFNPIYLKGSEGVGKTHLLMACAFYLTAQKKRCFYVKADTLTHHIVTAIRTGAMQKLREMYRHHDVLLVDDIPQLAHRSATQEELFHTFNTLHVAGKQIVLAGHTLPSKLEGIEPRLTSRFEWGLVLPFQLLNDEDRAEFFRQRLQDRKLFLLQEVQDYLLKEFSTVKALTAALEIVRLQKKKEPLTLSLTQTAMKPLLEEQKKKALTPDKIVRTVAEAFEIKATDILGRAQSQEYSLPRQISMYLCRFLLKMSFLRIADFFSRDHSTVMTSVKAIEKKLGEHDKIVFPSIHEIQSRLKS